jgi:hypothetical protein
VTLILGLGLTEQPIPLTSEVLPSERSRGKEQEPLEPLLVLELTMQTLVTTKQEVSSGTPLETVGTPTILLLALVNMPQ